MAGTLPPLFAITDDDHGGYVCVASYTLLILMVLLVVTRVFTRWYVVKFIKADDILLMVAAVLGVLQCVFVQLAVNHGLGKKRRIVPDGEFDLYQKYQYAARIVLAATVAASKISLALLIMSLMGEARSLLASRSLLGIIIAWSIAAIFTIAFECAPPNPWDTARGCIDQRAAYYGIWSIGIITDALLFILPCWVFWRVQDKLRRYRVVVLFGARLIVCVITGVQMHYVNESMTSSDPTWSNMNVTILDQFIMNFSIICTAIPSLGRLIVELQPEVNAFAITEQHGLRNNDKYTFNSFGHRFQPEYVANNRLGVHTSIFGRNARNSRDAESARGLREDDEVKPNTNVIKQTVDFQVNSVKEASSRSPV